MAYFNYHAKAKKLINDGKLIHYELVLNYHGIKPALVLYFSSCRPMPIREHHWQEYFKLIKSKNITKKMIKDE